MATSLQELASADAATETKVTETPTVTTEATTATPSEAASTDRSDSTLATSDSDSEIEDGVFRALLKEDFGLDASKYTNDYEAVKGLVEASRTIGARNEDAEYGKQVKQLLSGRESEFQAWLDSQKNGKSTDTTKSSTTEIPTWEQYQLLAAQASAENASATTKQRYADVQAEATRRLYESGRNPETIVQPVMDKVMAKVEEMLAQRMGAQTEQTVIDQMVSRNAEWLHVDGDTTKPMTTAGEEAYRLYQEELADGVKPPRALEKAIRQAQRGINAGIKPIRKPVIGGRRQPTVAAPVSDAIPLDTLFKSKHEGGQGKTLSEVAQAEWEKMRSGK